VTRLPKHMVANCGETALKSRWELDFHRMEFVSHLSLSFGVHRCMGARLTGLVVESMLGAIH
jgi:cytochrome P450